jgi:hypothetical protein
VLPALRILLRNRFTGMRRYLQGGLDVLLRTGIVRRLFGNRRMIEAHAGNVVVMAGSTCLHRVLSVKGGDPRYAIVICYDVPGATFPKEIHNNYYGYLGRKEAWFVARRDAPQRPPGIARHPNSSPSRGYAALASPAAARRPRVRRAEHSRVPGRAP